MTDRIEILGAVRAGEMIEKQLFDGGEALAREITIVRERLVETKRIPIEKPEPELPPPSPEEKPRSFLDLLIQRIREFFAGIGVNLGAAAFPYKIQDFILSSNHAHVGGTGDPVADQFGINNKSVALAHEGKDSVTFSPGNRTLTLRRRYRQAGKEDVVSDLIIRPGTTYSETLPPRPGGVTDIDLIFTIAQVVEPSGATTTSEFVTTTPQPPVVTAYACQTCGASFPSTSLLDAHIRAQHPYVQPSFTCPICKAVFPNATLLDEHMKSNHPEAGGVDIQTVALVVGGVVVVGAIVYLATRD